MSTKEQHNEEAVETEVQDQAEQSTEQSEQTPVDEAGSEDQRYVELVKLAEETYALKRISIISAAVRLRKRKSLDNMLP
jgi:hypothetical protein